MIYFTNTKPSKEYFKNIKIYKEIHKKGYQSKRGNFVSSAETYSGGSTREFAKVIKKNIRKNSIENMLDYGCGKGFFYDNSF